MSNRFIEEHAAAISLLLDKGGPVIRYRTTVELLGCTQGPEFRSRLQDLVESPLAQKWLANLVCGCTHASWDNAFENAMGKLIDMGFRAGISPFDARTKPFLRAAGELPEYDGIHKTLEIAIFLGGLIRAGYDTPALKELLRWRLAMLYEAVKDRSYDIYASETESRKVPHSYRRMPLVRPEFYEPHGLRLPYVHDLLALSGARTLLRPNDRLRADAVIKYVLDDRYQALHRGYGCLVRMDRGRPRCNGIGWSVHLPGFRGFDQNTKYPDLVLMVELLGHFTVARKHPWFQSALRRLDCFRTNRGTWSFPAAYLCERSGYYVIGAHMRLDPRASLELNSTLRMLCIKRMLTHE